MDFLCGFVLALYLFDGFMVECKTANGVDHGNLPDLPNELIEDILYISGFETTKKVAQTEMTISGSVMKRIFEDRIIKIVPLPKEYSATTETSKKGEPFLEIRNSDRVLPLFQQYGENVRKIHVYYNLRNDTLLRNINENIIKMYAHQLTELGIFILNDKQLWKDISNKQGQIHFPEVTKFIYDGSIRKTPFDLKSIFPKLQSFELVGTVVDTNCLANVMQLKELTLDTSSIQEHQLERIFANNKGILELSLRKASKLGALQYIDNHLKNLKTLKIKHVDSDFFIRSTNDVYNLTSVTHFDITFKKMAELLGNLPFDMPNLIKVRLFGSRIDHRIGDFIKHFKKLEIVCLKVLTIDSPVECIKSLIHIKELAIENFETTELSSLKEFFGNFDKTISKLETLKLIGFKDAQYQFYVKTMKNINDHLKADKKPIWILSHGKMEETGEKCLIFIRNS